ncbi:MAG: deoxycytidylate deaminase [Psychroserpens sp.]|jgi:deoxycytidylate deaminase
MKITFTGNYSELQDKLSSLSGEWEENQPNKKVFKLNGVVMNWFETTGTIQFQGKPRLKEQTENIIKHCLYPEDFEKVEDTILNIEHTAVEISQPNIVEKEQSISDQYLHDDFDKSEIVIGLVSAVGTEIFRVLTPLTDRLKGFGYDVIEIKASALLPKPPDRCNEYERIKHYMTEGDQIRKSSNNNGILAYGAVKLITENRHQPLKKTAYIINSLKHPDEVSLLRKVYGQGFYLIGIHSDKIRRINYLTNDKGMSQKHATELVNIDEDEKIKHGQKTRDTFHLSDFYLNFGKNDDQVKNTIQRFLELIFSHPYKNPTFDEFAMYMAFSSSIRSGDLSRQVGAVISKNKQIIATGANEVPSGGGGHYWSEINEETGVVYDIADGKDYMRFEDSNKIQQKEIIESLKNSISEIEGIDASLIDKITEKLKNSRINDLTEFGRVVHAEMQAILSCAKEGISCSSATLFCTTFPCHNCAKHLIASGINRVVYVEPYPKSKALEFHSESICTDTKDQTKNSVLFEPFIGVGARRFLDFFSMSSGAGSKLKRKNKDGTTLDWDKDKAKLRVTLLPESYLEVEKSAIKLYTDSIKN